LGVAAEKAAEKGGSASSSSGAGAGASRPQPTPPRPAAAAGAKRAKALYAFSAQSADELSFNEGDLLTVVSQSGDWWTAELSGKRGLIPANYVQLV